MEAKNIFLSRTDKSLLRTEVTVEEQEYRKAYNFDEKRIFKEKIKCTACDKNIKEKILSNLKVFIHPALEVIVCNDCQDFYADGEFSIDEDGSDKYCRWCGQGGHLYCCSQCTVTICSKCIKRNFNKNYIDEIERDDWKCFICETKPIWDLRALCNAIKQYVIDKNKKNAKRKNTSASDTQDSDSLETRSKKKKRIISNNDADENVEKNMKYTDVEMEKSDNTHQATNKNLHKLLHEDAIDVIGDFEKLIKLMIKNKDNLVIGYLENKQFLKNIDKISVLKEKIIGLIRNSKQCLEKIERNFVCNWNAHEFSSDHTLIIEDKNENDAQTTNEDEQNSVSKKIVFDENKKNELPNEKENTAEVDNKGICNWNVHEFPADNAIIIEDRNKNDAKTKDENKEQNSVNKKIFFDENKKKELVTEEENNSEADNKGACIMIEENKIKTDIEKDEIHNESFVIENTINETLNEKAAIDEMDTIKKVDKNIIVEEKNTLNLSENLDDESTINKNISTLKEIDLIKNSSNENKLYKTDNESQTLIHNKKNEIAKASLLLFSSDSDNSYERENELRSNESGMSSINFKSDDIKSQKKLKKKKNSKAEEKIEQKEKVDPDNKIDEEINRLSNLNNLNRTKNFANSNKNNTSDDSEKENKKKKPNIKKKDEKKSLEEYLPHSNSDANEKDESDSSFSKFCSFIESKQNFCLNKNEMSKKMLLDSSDSGGNTLNSDVELFIEAKSEKVNKKKRNLNCGEKLNNDCNSDDNEVRNNVQSSDEDNIKTSRSKWKSDKLMRLNLSKIDTSEEDKMINKIHVKRDKKLFTRAKKCNDISSDSDDIFMQKNSNLISKKKRTTHLSSSGSDNNFENSSSNSGSVNGIFDNDSNFKKKKTRKRIRIYKGSQNSESDNEVLTQGSTSKGRKNIRKVMDDTDLTETTRRMAKEEDLRKKRISERQALFNETFKIQETSEETLSHLVLDFDFETKEPLISVHPDLVKKLKPHQVKGVKFMWDSCFESIKQIKNNVESGCILAHCMGLGKTLQVITLIHTVLTYKETGVKTVLVICPLTTVLNWVNEFEIWLSGIDSYDIDVFHLTNYKNNIKRAEYLKYWSENGGVMIIGYDMFRSLINNSKISKKYRDNIYESLLNPGPNLVICDEGHILKNENTAVSQATMKIKTYRRIVLTGTPLQNNLKEYHCMVQFVKPRLLGDKKEFLNRFANPITNGQYIDSTKEDVRLMKRRAHVLHKMLDGIVQRFDYNVLTPFLPPKHEFVISVALSDLQAYLYEYYIRKFSRISRGGESSLFKDYQIMRLIWTHPLAMKIGAERSKKYNVESDTDSLADFVVSGSETDDSSIYYDSDKSDNSVISVNSNKSNYDKKNKNNKKNLRSNSEKLQNDCNNEVSESYWWSKFITNEDIENYKQGPKLVLLFAILRACETIGDKVLIFSQSIPSLDMIEYFLQKTDEFSYASSEPSLLPDYFGIWKKNVDYFRLDGQTSNEMRTKYCKIFNRQNNLRSRLFLISTKAGGLGINLTAANRVIIFDASWNPSYDVQSIFRIYRFGQKKPCYIYRFLAQGTMEEKIYERQITKLSISCRVVDEQQIDRHFSHNEIEELYTFNRKFPSEDEIPKLPKDRLMAELLKEYKNIILSYHEHDSLLENVVDEELTEEERIHAWEEYENEKNKKLIPNLTLASNLNNPTNVSAMINTTICDELILSSLRKEHPEQNDEKLYSLIPIIREKLKTFYENVRENQLAKNMQIGNNLKNYASQKEVNDQA